MAKDMDNTEEELDSSELPDESDVKGGEDESGTYPCPYCGKQVYEDAVRCPNCQRYVSPHGGMPAIVRWGIILMLLSLAGMVIWALVK